jgi:hypothetical protein
MDTLIKQLQDRDLSAKTIAALVRLDDPKLKVGYGLCEAAGQSLFPVVQGWLSIAQ